jgi:hypothetical protein
MVLGECLEAEGLQTPRLRTDQHPHLLLSISMLLLGFGWFVEMFQKFVVMLLLDLQKRE